MSAFTAIAAAATSVPVVADVMHPGIVSCSRNDSLERVAELMATRRLHCVVVTDDAADAKALWGVISDLDLVAAASVRELADQRAGVTAATPAITIAPTDSLQRAGYLMTKHGVSHLIVVEPGLLRPVGVVSTLDLADALAAQDGRRACMTVPMSGSQDENALSSASMSANPQRSAAEAARSLPRA